MSEAKVDQLTQLARERERNLGEQQAEIAKQQNLLEHDRDIAELKGARHLHIAEVHDVGGSGGDRQNLRPRLLYQREVAPGMSRPGTCRPLAVRVTVEVVVAYRAFKAVAKLSAICSISIRCIG